MRRACRMRQRYGSADGGKFRRQSTSLLRGSKIPDVGKPVSVKSFSGGWHDCWTYADRVRCPGRRNPGRRNLQRCRSQDSQEALARRAFLLEQPRAGCVTSTGSAPADALLWRPEISDVARELDVLELSLSQPILISASMKLQSGNSAANGLARAAPRVVIADQA
jgi:hypothetical protein